MIQSQYFIFDVFFACLLFYLIFHVFFNIVFHSCKILFRFKIQVMGNFTFIL
jgi:hypothetical protein